MKTRNIFGATLPRLAKLTWTPLTAFVLAAALAGLVTSCATAPKTQPKKFIYFPGPPDEPHLQFLTSFSTETDVRGVSSSTFQEFITGEKPTDYALGKPYGIAVRGNKFYICDSLLHSVVIMDLGAHKLLPLKAPEESGLIEPLNIAIDDNEDRYITDDVLNQVVCLDGHDRLKWSLGNKGEMKPKDVALSKDRLYVTDTQSHCVRVYDKATRQPLFIIPHGKDASNTDAMMALPTNLALDNDGSIYVCDSFASRVQVFDNAGNYVRTIAALGDNPQKGTLKRPKGIAVNNDGILFVVDAAYQVVQMYNKAGEYLMWFGYPGDTPAALTLPAKVIVDYKDVGLFQQYAAPDFVVEHLVIVTSQFGSRKVSIFGYGHKK